MMFVTVLTAAVTVTVFVTEVYKFKSLTIFGDRNKIYRGLYVRRSTLKINLKARLKNKTFLISSSVLIISFVYRLLAMLEIVPPVGEKEIVELFNMAVNVLALLGVVVDPTTEGVCDSERAMTYCSENDERKCD